MKKIMTVFGFTFRDAVGKKAFLISTVIILVLMLVLFALPMLIGSPDSSGPDGGVGPIPTPGGEPVPVTVVDKTCYYIDEDNLIPNGHEALVNAFSDTMVIPARLSDLEQYREAVKNSGDHSIVVVSAGEDLPFVQITTQTFMNGISSSAVISTLSRTYVVSALEEKGLDPDTIKLSQSSLSFATDIAGSMDLSGYVLGIAFTLLMFFAVYYYGYGVAMSVATEKTSRVMETLVVSAKPSSILIGKCLAMGALGLLQFTVILAFGAVLYRLLVPADFVLMGMPLSLSAFTWQSAVLILIFFLLGYMLYAVMNAACGAMVSKIEDLNSAMMPVMLIAMISFYGAYFIAISQVEGVVEKIVMYLPFSAPFIMPFKILNKSAAASDIVFAILALVVAIVLIAWFSIRIYSASVLHYGKKLKLREIGK